MFRKFHLILDDVKHLLLFIISFSKTFLSNVGSSQCRDRMVDLNLLLQSVHITNKVETLIHAHLMV